MDPNQRLDYFRSELEGKLAEVRKDINALQLRIGEELGALDRKIDTLTREIQHLRMAR